ncbi:MAG: TraR/DksA family transcriptional regulator [Pirellulaceae bacterium]|nr:TraR/DksA family transcriptional regulator [Pirellulaceae bacterium]
MSSHDKLKAQLQAKLQELELRVQRIDSRLSDPGVADWEENAALHSNDEVLTGLGELTEKDIHEIRLALHRIDSGTYGTCVGCGSEIPKARLDALPFASTCVSCAS